MVTVYRFRVSYKIKSASGKVYRKRFDSVAFVRYEIAIAAFRSWSRFQKEHYADSGKYFEVVSFFVESSIEDLPIDDIYCLTDCKKINCYGYASEYWCPF